MLQQSDSASAPRFLLLPLGQPVESKVCNILILNASKLQQYKALASIQSPSSRIIIEDKGLESWVQELLLDKRKYVSFNYI